MPYKPADAPIVSGWVASGFEPVREQFERNIADRGELGGAVAVYLGGQPIVDLWGGYADRARTRPWRADTLTLVFSTTKGMAAAAMAVAESRGLFELDARVAEYWPEFASNRKEQVTVRQLLGHQAGLCALDLPLNPAFIADRDRLGDALARQRPAWTPGTRHGYHAMTLGWYESQLISRVDPQHRTMAEFFQDEVASAVGTPDFHIGLPHDMAPDRVADLDGWPAWRMLGHLNTMPAGMVLAYLRPGSLTARTMGNPHLSSPTDFASTGYRSLEIPAATGFGTARAIAAVYADLATGGSALGIDESTMRSITGPPVPPTGGTRDLVLHIDSRFSHGWWRPFPSFPFGSSQAFGAPGAGGSFGFADPASGVGYGYVTNRMGFHIWDDPRDLALRTAVRQCMEYR